MKGKGKYYLRHAVKNVDSEGEKFVYLMTNENADVIKAVPLFVSNSFKL